jgi:Domain of unknown function (DUF4349)
VTSSETTLEWVDAALDAGEPTTSDPIGREVQELALALRAESRAAPDPAFEARLSGRVAGGFPRRSRLRFRRPRLAVAAGLATAVAAAVVGISVLTGEEKTAPAPHIAVAPRPETQPAQPSTSGLRSGNSLRSLNSLQATVSPRRVERSAQITLSAPDSKIQQLADGVVAVTGRHHGFVQRESVSTGSPSTGGTIELKVPVTELDGTIRDLSALGHVRGRTENAEDVTKQYVSLSDRLTKARARRADLVRRIAHASSSSEADRLRFVLAGVDARIRNLRSGLHRLNQETNFANVEVSLQADRSSGAAGSSPKRALHDALGILSGSLAFAIRALAVLVPLGLAAVALWSGANALRRRRREAVLG